MIREYFQTIPDRVARPASPPPSDSPQFALGISCALGLALWGGLLSVGMICLLRRLSGGFHVALSNPHMLELWLACAGGLVLAFFLCRQIRIRFGRGRRLLTALLGSLPLLFWVMAFCPLRSLLGPSLGLAMTVGLVELLLRPRRLKQFWSYLTRWFDPLLRTLGEEGLPKSTSSEPPAAPRLRSLSSAQTERLANSPLPGTTQSFHRRLSGADEILEGELLAEFLPTERLRILHVSFTPSFASIPETDVSCEDSAIRATVAAKYCHGMRIEVRRLGANAAEQTRIHFSARAPRRVN